MRAMVRFANGLRMLRTITNIENDGSGNYGYVRAYGKKIPVSETTTIHHADGSVTEEWDEVVIGTQAEYVNDNDDIWE